jgi:hypothetical protein
MRGIISQKGPFSKNARPHGKILKKGPDKISNKVIYRVYKKNATSEFPKKSKLF